MDHYIAAGYAAAGKGYRGVVNEIEVTGPPKARLPAAPRLDSTLEGLFRRGGDRRRIIGTSSGPRIDPL